jgi:hypothetical protein
MGIGNFSRFRGADWRAPKSLAGQSGCDNPDFSSISREESRKFVCPAKLYPPNNPRAPENPALASMSVFHFVSGSATLLLGWLLVTFLTEVPAKSYPTLGRGSVPVSAQKSSASDPQTAQTALPSTRPTVDSPAKP